jgi:hypothetical protein
VVVNTVIVNNGSMRNISRRRKINNRGGRRGAGVHDTFCAIGA